MYLVLPLNYPKADDPRSECSMAYICHQPWQRCSGWSGWIPHVLQAHPCEPSEDIKTGDCLLITYKGKKSSREFVGLVTDTDSEGLEVQFLRRNYELGLVYILPTKELKSWVVTGQVIQCLNPFVNNRGRYHFKDAVLAE